MAEDMAAEVEIAVITVVAMAIVSDSRFALSGKKNNLTSFPQVVNTVLNTSQPVVLEQQSTLHSTRLPWQ